MRYVDFKAAVRSNTQHVDVIVLVCGFVALKSDARVLNEQGVVLDVFSI